MLMREYVNTSNALTLARTCRPVTTEHRQKQRGVLVSAQKLNKKLRYREEHSASIVLSWCRPTL